MELEVACPFVRFNADDLNSNAGGIVKLSISQDQIMNPGKLERHLTFFSDFFPF